MLSKKGFVNQEAVLALVSRRLGDFLGDGAVELSEEELRAVPLTFYGISQGAILGAGYTEFSSLVSEDCLAIRTSEDLLCLCRACLVSGTCGSSNPLCVALLPSIFKDVCPVGSLSLHTTGRQIIRVGSCYLGGWEAPLYPLDSAVSAVCTGWHTYVWPVLLWVHFALFGVPKAQCFVFFLSRAEIDTLGLLCCLAVCSGFRFCEWIVLCFCFWYF